MKSPYAVRWRTFGPCCICQKKLTDKRYSRYCCSKECDDIGEANMKAAIERGKAWLKKFFAGKPRYKEDETPLGQPTRWRWFGDGRR